MSKTVIIIKVDPEKRLVARIPIKPSVRGVRNIIGHANIGHRVLREDVNGERLIVGARIGQDPDRPVKEWRLRGTDNTVGVGILFGTLERSMDAMWHCPADLEWVKREIVWCEPGEVSPAEEVRELLGLTDAEEA